MSNRTKSFFEQDHGAKPRPAKWNNHNNDKNVLKEASTNTPLTKPPIPATSQAKSKLKAFQFVPGRPERPRHAEKENIGLGIEPLKSKNGVEKPSSQLGASSAVRRSDSPVKSVSSGARESTRATPHLAHANTFPCTPGTRLPLEDLIGNIDERPKRLQFEEQSPEDQIGWIPNSSSTLLTPNRKRKRARSSSPSCPHTSSQQRKEVLTFFNTSGPLVEKRTPEADPAADLWQQYATGNQKVDGLKPPDLSHLMFQASPRPLETPVKSAGLRRWASTGNEWPTSKTKRRRTNARANTGMCKDQQDDNDSISSGRSKVAAMVEKLQESLATQKLAQPNNQPGMVAEAPSSSSPLPDVGHDTSVDCAPPVSPLRARKPPRLESKPSSNKGATQRPATSYAALNTPSEPPPAPLNAMEHVNAMQDAVRPAPLHLESKAPLPRFKRPAITRVPSGCGRQYPVAKQASPKTTSIRPNDDIDEFDDGLDFSVEDLEELMTAAPTVTRSLYSIPQHPNPPPQQPIIIEDNELAERATQPSKVTPQGFDGTDDDEFACDIDEDSFAQAEFSATQTCRKPTHKRSPRDYHKSHVTTDPYVSRVPTMKDGVSSLHRYKVKQVIEGEYTNVKGRRCPEKLVIAEDERNLTPYAITLRDSWVDTAVALGNIVNIAKSYHSADSFNITESTPAGQIVVNDDNTSSLLIVHPDHMISATTVADSFDCVRKAVLQDRIKATGESSKAMVYGKVLHEIFQQALTANEWSRQSLVALVERTVQNHLESLWELGMTDTVLAVEEVTAKMGELAAWAKIFVATKPSDQSIVDDKQGDKIWISISKLIAIEEHVWSPQYGLKGNIDATIQSTVIDHPQQDAKHFVTPFEVKTGRTTQSPAHRAQTALYTLLLSDRYDMNITAGILYYLESSAMSRIAPSATEIRQMIQQRNRLASYIFRARNPPKEAFLHPGMTVQSQEIEESGLPNLLKNPFKCGRCYAQQSCFTYHALVENGSADSAGMIDDNKKHHSLTWHEAVGHLSTSKNSTKAPDNLRQWFTKWDKLLTFEESEVSRFRRELWTMPSLEREAVGRCFGGLVIKHDLSSTASATCSILDGIEGSGGKINRFAYVFCRQTPDSKRSFAEGTQLTIGEPVVVSSEDGQWALANGYVIAATKYEMTVAVDRKLGIARQRMNGFDETNNQELRGIMTVGGNNNNTAENLQTLFRLDKDEFSNGLALVRNNLVTLMSSHPIHTKLRDQVVNSLAPKFSASSGHSKLPLSQLGEMNEDQRASVDKVLNAQDYALILGMPGTGKTTTIAHIIRALLAEEKSVLLTSFTHTAVDNILLKLRDITPPNSILRLGVPAKINTEVQTFCQLAATPRKTIEEIEEVYMGTKIVATTCMGTNHALFNRRAFDVCIVDEASQITLPIALGPLLHARKFVLVGDHYQLPPLVQNRAALEGGLDVSLFRQLSEQHPEAVATLGKQYRMCEDIMSLSNELIYNGQLRCGSKSVATRTLQITNETGLRAFHNEMSHCTVMNSCWLSEVTRPERKVIFANTDAMDKLAAETLTSGKNITNHLEATLTAQMVLGFIALGVPCKGIGVITLYRSQLALIRQLFKAAGISNEVEIDSADRFQGRDKDCIILSMVRSNELAIVGDLLKDWRRVNVALTRARSKLIMLGSERTLRNNELLARFLSLVDSRGWVLNLPKGADSCHSFDFSSQSTAGLIPAGTPSPTSRRSVKTANTRPNSKNKSPNQDTSRILKASESAGNRSLTKMSSQMNKGMKLPGKSISGRRPVSSSKARALQELIVADIFEDLTGDDF
ncbi:Hypothetical protein R9X50_00241100 [Acrodontium crateriforme]|uniref:DNA replication ATP-dependent helicase/nuclease DNA2 n=1 Tax=Acrodontium crateriforme TaxID=150365 RepID=A0AAQ3R6M3_9PEZI|nr:Hypothetical protein R9X50_00241100 [Acrodontium crateriforme]